MLTFSRPTQMKTQEADSNIQKMFLNYINALAYEQLAANLANDV
jgi:hypothetical protein